MAVERREWELLAKALHEEPGLSAPQNYYKEP